MSGKELYERVRRHDPEKEHWNWLDQEVREFWEKLADIVSPPPPIYESSLR